MLFWIILFIAIGTLLRTSGEKSGSSFTRDTGRMFLLIAGLIGSLALFVWFVNEVIF